MTDPRPDAPLPDLESLRRRLAAVDARFDDPVGAAAARALLKGDIVVLFREADEGLRRFAALKEDVRALAAKWKQLPALEGEADPADLGGDRPLATPPGGHDAAPASGRADHLGASTFVAKGWTALSTGEYARAEEALHRALELAPADPEATAMLGWALAGQRRDDDALALLAGLLERDPRHGLARVSIGYAYLGRGSYGEAIEHLARAARDDDRKAALYGHFYLGVVYQRRDMYDDAVAFFRRALALGPNLLEAYYEMGRAHWLGGDRAAAVEAWRAGAAASKFNAWAKRCDGMRAVVEEGGDPLAA